MSGWKRDPKRHSLSAVGSNTKKRFNTDISCYDMSLYVNITKPKISKYMLPYAKLQKDIDECTFVDVMDYAYGRYDAGVNKMKINLLLKLFPSKRLSEKILVYLLMYKRNIIEKLHNDDTRNEYISRVNLYALINLMDIDDTIKNELITNFDLEEIREKLKDREEYLSKMKELDMIPELWDGRDPDVFIELLVSMMHYEVTGTVWEDFMVYKLIRLMNKLLIDSDSKLTKTERDTLLAYLAGYDGTSTTGQIVKEDKLSTISILIPYNVLYRVYKYKKTRKNRMPDIKRIESVMGERHGDTIIPYEEQGRLEQQHIKPSLIDLVIFIDDKYKDNMPLAMKESIYLAGTDGIFHRVFNITSDTYRADVIRALYKFMKDNSIPGYNELNSMYRHTLITKPDNDRNFEFYYKFIEGVYQNRGKLIELYQESNRNKNASMKIEKFIKQIYRTALGPKRKPTKDIKKFMDYIVMRESLYGMTIKYPDYIIEQEPVQLYDWAKERVKARWNGDYEKYIQPMQNKKLSEILSVMDNRVLRDKELKKAYHIIYESLDDFNKNVFKYIVDTVETYRLENLRRVIKIYAWLMTNNAHINRGDNVIDFHIKKNSK